LLRGIVLDGKGLCVAQANHAPANRNDSLKQGANRLHVSPERGLVMA
jgi:hypothetical protein